MIQEKKGETDDLDLLDREKRDSAEEDGASRDPDKSITQRKLIGTNKIASAFQLQTDNQEVDSDESDSKSRLTELLSSDWRGKGGAKFFQPLKEYLDKKESNNQINPKLLMKLDS